MAVYVTIKANGFHITPDAQDDLNAMFPNMDLESVGRMLELATGVSTGWGNKRYKEYLFSIKHGNKVTAAGYTNGVRGKDGLTLCRVCGGAGFLKFSEASSDSEEIVRMVKCPSSPCGVRALKCIDQPRKQNGGRNKQFDKRRTG